MILFCCRGLAWVHEMGGRRRVFLNLAAGWVCTNSAARLSLKSGACWELVWIVSTGNSMFASIPCRPVGDPSRPVSMPCRTMCWAAVSSLRRPRLGEKGKDTSCKPAVLGKPSHCRWTSWGQSIDRFSISQGVEMKTRLLTKCIFYCIQELLFEAEGGGRSKIS